MGVDFMMGINSIVFLFDYVVEMISFQGIIIVCVESNFNLVWFVVEVVVVLCQNIEGVSIDEEMQNFMLIEQSFVVNL